jgi:sec-independent protein translocase protein TatA
MPFGAGIGIWKVLIIVVLLLLLFGTRKLPSLGRAAGKGLREFKDQVTEYKEPIAELKEAVAVNEVKEIASMANPRKALAAAPGDEAAAETRTEA